MQIGDFVIIPSGNAAGTLGEIVEIYPKEVILLVGNVRVRVDRAMLEAMDEAEAKAEATNKRARPTKGQEKGEEKSRRPATPPPAKPKPTTTVTQQPPAPILETETKKKEVTTIMLTPTTTPVTQQPPAQPARVEPAYCPLDGNIRRRPTDIVCGECYRIYVDEAAIGLARGQPIGNVFEWVAGKAAATVAKLEGELVAAESEIGALGKKVAAETAASLKANAGGQQVAEEVWRKAFGVKKAELWRANGGNAKFAKMKGLESRIALLRSILEKSKEPKPAPPAPATTVAFTAPPTTPPATSPAVTTKPATTPATETETTQEPAPATATNTKPATPAKKRKPKTEKEAIT